MCNFQGNKNFKYKNIMTSGSNYAVRFAFKSVENRLSGQ